MAAKKTPAVTETKEPPEPAELPKPEVPGWPGVIAETPEEHDARRKAEAEQSA